MSLPAETSFPLAVTSENRLPYLESQAFSVVLYWAGTQPVVALACLPSDGQSGSSFALD